MFIREVKKKIKKSNSEYNYIQHILVESIRTPNGPRQKNILNLGTLDIDRKHFKDLANSIEAIVTKHHQKNLFAVDKEVLVLAQHFATTILKNRVLKEQDEELNYKQESGEIDDKPRYETVDINSLNNTNAKTIGSEHIALEQLKQLSLFSILSDCGFSQKQQTYAAAQICARLVHPSSERETARWLKESSALDELMSTDFKNISDHTLHMISDKLFKNKDTLEKRLSKKTEELLFLDDTLILYDLTNTYFESPKRQSNKANCGHSKEKRYDCPLLTLALVVDSMGFPKKSEIYKGNVNEGGTLFEILDKLYKTRDGLGKQTVVIDAGIATEANILKLREDKRFDYVGICRSKKYDEAIFSKAPSSQIEVSRGETITVKSSVIGEELFLLCQSPQKEAKERAIFEQKRQRFEKGIKALSDGLKKKKTKKSQKSILERIGRLKEKYKVGHFYNIEIKTEEEKVVEIIWSFNETKKRKPGEYLIRTNRVELKENELSRIHRTLTMIESSFRFMKSDLGLRPNYHQKDKRMEAHIFISVLAYFVLAPLLNKLRWGGDFIGASKESKKHTDWSEPYGWQGVVRCMSTQERITTSFKCKNGDNIDIRTTTEPNTSQRKLLKRLKLKQKPLPRVILTHPAK